MNAKSPPQESPKTSKEAIGSPVTSSSNVNGTTTSLTKASAANEQATPIDKHEFVNVEPAPIGEFISYSCTFAYPSSDDPSLKAAEIKSESGVNDMKQESSTNLRRASMANSMNEIFDAKQVCYHTIPYHTIPSLYHTIPYHTIPYHTIL